MENAGASSQLAPGLLLAAPALGDPNFHRSVVLLGYHDEDGAVGWVLNGLAVAPAGEVLSRAGLAVVSSAPSLERLVRVGGPVLPGSAWLLFERAEGDLAGAVYEGQLDVDELHAVAGARAAIEAAARGDGPRRFQILLGYAGWGPGQLEREIQAGAWLPAPLAAADLVGGDPDALWDAAYQRAVGVAPAAFTSGPRGSA